MKKIIMFFLMAIISIRVIADTEIVNGNEWYYEIENEKAEIIPEPDEEPEEMTHTSTTEVPVPYVWLNAYPELMSRYECDYEAAANSVAANGINKVWECYVAGLNPTDITAKFISIITFNENSPVITWDPNVEGRIYTIEGTSTLNPLEWDTPTNETHRFFRVKVSLPQEGDEGGTTDKIIMILFDARGGSVSPDNITYESNGVLGELPIPTFEGYAFVGWFDDINGGTEYTSTTPVPHEDMTLYAVWEAETYTVTFNANGGSGEMSNQTFTYGVEQALSSNTFTLEGYGFAGWATSPDGDVVYADCATVKNLISVANGVVDLYAKWDTTYTVCFNANGGEGTMLNQTITHSVKQALSLNTFTLEGYGFAGWATSADGDVVYADGEVVKNLTSEANGVVDLYAKWETTYTVCFNANGGEGTMLNQTITHSVEQSLASNEFKRDGYFFAGWATSQYGDVIYENAEKVKNLTSEANSEIHLYAVWKSFFVYEGEHKGVQLWKDGPHWAETNIGAKNPEDFGDYFWWGDTVGYKRENEQWVSRYGSSSTFSFEASNTPTYGKDITKLLSGGWITSNGVLAPAHDAAQVKWGSKWRMPTYDDLFGLVVNCTHTWTTKNGVEGYEIKGKGDYSGASIFLPAAGYGDGTQLQLQGSCGRYLSSVPSLARSTSNTELNFFGSSGDFYVHNTSYRSMGCSIRPVVNQQYTVRFNANGGSGYDKMPDQLFTYGIEQPLSPNSFYRDGYTFAGWTTEIKNRRVFLSDNMMVKNLTTKANGIVELCAVWITKSYTQLWEDGPYWAGANIGAEKPWDYGYYFWWGDTTGYKSNGTSFSFSFDSSNTPTYGKNNETLLSNGWISSNGVLLPEHDAARVHLGEKWRMPTHMELYNLYERCPSVWVTINGVSGYLFSKSKDYSESIFLPAAGYGNENSLIGANLQGFYWSSVISRSSGDSYYLYFDSELAPRMLDSSRHFGQPIRPVLNHTFIVRFNANGGLGTMEDQTFSYGVEQALAANAFTREGYTFAGWATSADGEVVHVDGEKVENLTSEADGIVCLYAVWKINTNVSTHKGIQLWENGPYWAETNIGAENPEDYGYYFWWGDTVGYRPNGSSFNFSFDDSNTPTYGKTYSELKSEGWITSSGVLAPSHDAARAHWGSNWRMPTDSELEALCDNCTWTRTSVNGVNGYIVRGKGAYSVASIFLPAAGCGDGTSLIGAGSTGYYWWSVPDSEGVYCYYSWSLYFNLSRHCMNIYDRYFGQPVRPVSDSLESDVVTYSVHFNANGGSGEMSSQTFTYGVEQALAANAFTCEGYTFAGWATSADGEVACVDGANISVSAPTTLYAVWTPNTYTVTFNANGGSGEMSYQTFTYGVEQALSLNLYYNVSCTFEGWATSADGEVVYADGEVVENLTKEVDGVIELFAVWKVLGDKVQLWEGGPYWATRNIGATNPEDYGLYFWWGDTVGYRPNGSSFSFNFDWIKIPTSGKSNSQLKSEGWITSSGVLAPSHDAARAHWGSNWRMPTFSELGALRDNCTWTWTTKNGVNGYVVSGKGAYSGASIFLPAAGYGDGTSLRYAGSGGYYWSSVPYSVVYLGAWYLNFFSNILAMECDYRYGGQSVRPVSDVH